MKLWMCAFLVLFTSKSEILYRLSTQNANNLGMTRKHQGLQQKSSRPHRVWSDNCSIKMKPCYFGEVQNPWRCRVNVWLCRPKATLQFRNPGLWVTLVFLPLYELQEQEVFSRFASLRHIHAMGSYSETPPNRSPKQKKLTRGTFKKHTNTP